jgi:predicted dehydrogenase
VADRVKVGIIGCGNIAPAYVRGCGDFSIIELVGCADLEPERASTLATAHQMQAYSTVEELLADPEIQIAINLTVPSAHVEVSLKIIEAGKHVYSEKPLAINRADGEKIIEAARAARVRVGCAPDTFLGGGIQTCRKLIDDGWIGQPVAATAFLASHGPESWHPNPWFFYQAGGGPVFDMAPYYLTALINLLGPIRRVTGSSRASFPERIATSEALYGQRIPVEVDTHMAGVLDFASGAVGTLITSFDIWKHNLPRIEIYGSQGSISVPDPNTFGGPVRVWQVKDGEWRDVATTHDTSVSRGIGVADMAYGVRSGRPHRASGELAFHVLDLMDAFGEASRSGQHREITSQCAQPAALPLDLLPGTLDD